MPKKKQQEHSREDFVSQLIYSMPGAGKTAYCWSAMQFVGPDRTLWLNTEQPITHLEIPDGVVVDVQDMSINDLRKQYIAPALAAAERGEWRYDLVIVDGVSESDLRNFETISSGKGPRDKRQQWGVQLDDMIHLFWSLRRGTRTPKPVGLGAHVIVTARTRAVPNPTAPRNEDGSINNIYLPAIRGQAGDLSGAYFDQVLYLEQFGHERRIYLKAQGTVHVKNRWEHKSKDSIVVPPFEEGNAFEEVLKGSGLI